MILLIQHVLLLVLRLPTCNTADVVSFCLLFVKEKGVFVVALLERPL
jgi:hypothetical protein